MIENLAQQHSLDDWIGRVVEIGISGEFRCHRFVALRSDFDLVGADLIDLSVMPVVEADSESEWLVRGKLWVTLAPVSWLAPKHREQIETVLDEILEAFGPGYWEFDRDELFDFSTNDAVVAELIGASS